jgi:hypothetical protein
MTMRARTTPGESAEQEHGDAHIAVVGPDEVVRAALEWQVLLTNAVHPADAPVDRCDDTAASGRHPKIPLGLRTVTLGGPLRETSRSSVPVGRDGLADSGDLD